ncbi:hypothetical protein ACEQ8H_007886 [Pleosporales sp. CAS-2024a]
MPKQQHLHHLLLLLSPPPSLRTALLPPRSRTYTLLAPPSRHLSLPRVLQPTFWASLVPQPLRTRSQHHHQDHHHHWNPATPYIVLGLLVGSQAIQILWLKQDQGRALSRAEAKIALLREVIGRVQRGEDVDVEKMLGTGDPGREKEWAEMLKDLETEELLFQSKKKRRALRQEAAGDDENERDKDKMSVTHEHEAKVKVESINGVKFY